VASDLLTDHAREHLPQRRPQVTVGDAVEDLTRQRMRIGQVTGRQHITDEAAEVEVGLIGGTSAIHQLLPFAAMRGDGMSMVRGFPRGTECISRTDIAKSN
jgi:hypothetical protein